jgi:hypothetical protein
LALSLFHHQPGYLDWRQRASQQFLISLSGIFLQKPGSPTDRPATSGAENFFAALPPPLFPKIEI